MEEHDTWSAGVVAQKGGQPISDCPYEDGTPAAKGWKGGWRAAWAADVEREMEDDD